MQVFLLEDADIDRLLLQTLLRRSGLNVTFTHVKTVKEAELLLPSLEAIPFDCALIKYPVPSGSVFNLLANPKFYAVPAILLTDVNDSDVAAKALQAGFQDYLVKDKISQDSLVCAINLAIERNRIRYNLITQNDRLSKLVQIDELTGVMNRRGLEDVLSNLDCAGTSHVVVLLDIDDFKTINDVHGYSTGDEILKIVSRKMQSLARAGDEIARIGGDEFLLLLRNQTKEQGAAIADRIRYGLESSLIHIDEHELNITVSIGISTISGGSDINGLLKLTQDALHTSKVLGKNVTSVAPSIIPPKKE